MSSAGQVHTKPFAPFSAPPLPPAEFSGLRLRLEHRLRFLLFSRWQDAAIDQRSMLAASEGPTMAQRTTFLKRSRPDARHASQNVTIDAPAGFEVVQQLPTSCPKVASKLPREPRLDTKYANYGNSWAIRQLLASFDRTWPRCANISAQHDQRWRNQSIHSHFVWSKLGRGWPTFGRNCPNFGRVLDCLGNAWALLGQLLVNFGATSQMVGIVGSIFP